MPISCRGRGFDLQAAVVAPPRDRSRLERLCRYALRPPLAEDRLRLTPERRAALELRHRWAALRTLSSSLWSCSNV